MEKEQICSSAFVINDQNEILLIYHKKFGKYVQPGGHIEGNEEKWEASIREVFEETGIEIEIVDKEPFAKEIYNNNVGRQVDYQFYAVPKNLNIVHNGESFEAGWFSMEEIDSIPVVDDLKDKFKFVLQKYREGGKYGKRKNLNK